MIIQERTFEEHKKFGILKRDQKRQKKIEAAGIDYDCPEIVRISSYMLLTIMLCLNGYVWLL